MVTPAFLPSARIACSERCRCGPASTCTVMMSAPALAKASRCGSHGAIIRCTSSIFCVMRPDRLHHIRPERDDRHEMAVHDVEMDPVGAGGFDRAHLLGELGEVGGQDRRGDDERALHRALREIIGVRLTCRCRAGNAPRREAAGFAGAARPRRFSPVAAPRAPEKPLFSRHYGRGLGFASAGAGRSCTSAPPRLVSRSSKEFSMSLSVNGSNSNNPYAYLQSLLQQGLVGERRGAVRSIVRAVGGAWPAGRGCGIFRERRDLIHFRGDGHIGRVRRRNSARRRCRHCSRCRRTAPIRNRWRRSSPMRRAAPTQPGAAEPADPGPARPSPPSSHGRRRRGGGQNPLDMLSATAAPPAKPPPTRTARRRPRSPTPTARPSP